MRLFSLCQATDWATLPVAGGWYDQHPDLIEKFMIILREKHDHDEREQRRKKASKPQTRGM